jgi:hypothetical protein
MDGGSRFVASPRAALVTGAATVSNLRFRPAMTERGHCQNPSKAAISARKSSQRIDASSISPKDQQ